MNVLVACEESQAVCKAFREKGHQAFSCDILDCSGEHPEWHIKDDVMNVINGYVRFETCDGEIHHNVYYGTWDMVIAFPPCTYLTVTGNRWFNVERYGEKAKERWFNRFKSIDFFKAIAGCNCEKVAIENPIGVMSSCYRKPDQIIHPYMFGEPERKATCLWLKNLPKLKPTDIVEPRIIKYKNGKGTDSPWHMDTMGLPGDERAKLRSKTFKGIADAMAEQWGQEELNG